MRQVHFAGLDLPAATDTCHATLSIWETTATNIIDVLHKVLSYLIFAYTAGLETAAAIGLDQLARKFGVCLKGYTWQNNVFMPSLGNKQVHL